MRRRDFLTSVLGGAAATIGATATTASAMSHEAHAQKESARQYYELRRYHIGEKGDRGLIDQYWREAAIPAYNRLGVKPVGVFEPTEDSDDAGQMLYVLLPYASLQQMMHVRQQLPEDSAYQQAGEPYLRSPKGEPAYNRIESKLMIAFTGQPQMRIPAPAKNNESPLFELRTYESHNEHKARRKVEMFNKREMQLFKDLGFPQALFHGETIVGNMMPNLSYMLAYDNREQRDRLWDKFINSEGWAELSSMERYQNTVSKVHNWFLRSTGYSQI